MRDLTRRFSARVVEHFNRGPRAEGVLFRAAVDTSPAEILVYDVIGADYWGEGVTAKGIMSSLTEANGGPVVVRINSPGGDVFEGMAIYNHLKVYSGDVSVVIDGLAASAASVIAMVGGSVTMNDGSMFMIHNAWTIAMGDRNDFAKQADTLGKIDGQIANIYAAFADKPAADFAAAMDAETWYTAQEAVDAGLATSAAAPAKRPAAPAASAEKPAAEVDHRTIRALRVRVAQKF